MLMNNKVDAAFSELFRCPTCDEKMIWSKYTKIDAENILLLKCNGCREYHELDIQRVTDLVVIPTEGNNAPALFLLMVDFVIAWKNLAMAKKKRVPDENEIKNAFQIYGHAVDKLLLHDIPIEVLIAELKIEFKDLLS